MVKALGALLWGLVMLPLTVTDNLPGAALLFFVGGAIWGPYTAVEATACTAGLPPPSTGGSSECSAACWLRLCPSELRSVPWHWSGTILCLSALACTCSGAMALVSSDLRRAG